MKARKLILLVGMMMFGMVTLQAEIPVEKVAKAHGMLPLPEFESITYTFLAQVGEKRIERTWTWWPAANRVKDHGSGIEYSREAIPEEALAIDPKFINDHYWLFFPWRAATDGGREVISSTQPVPAPMSGKDLHRVTVVYANDVGYTPGDAYDLYVDENGVIQEWAFRKAGGEVVTRQCSWGNYQNFAGMKLATDMRGPDGFRIQFTDIYVVE
jgi:hypothetical protein